MIEIDYHGEHKAQYQGEWHFSNNMSEYVRQGRGLLERENGECYEGFFFNNLFHGKGKFTYAADDAYGRDKCVGYFESN